MLRLKESGELQQTLEEAHAALLASPALIVSLAPLELEEGDLLRFAGDAEAGIGRYRLARDLCTPLAAGDETVGREKQWLARTLSERLNLPGRS